MAQEPIQDYGYNAHYTSSQHPMQSPTTAPGPYYQTHASTPRALEPYPASPLQANSREPQSPYGLPPPQSYHPGFQFQQPPYAQGLPPVSTFATAGQVFGNGGPQLYDTTGQVAPPGMRPRLTTSLSEEEGSLCFQVDVNGICVARREDNHMINGTKLLNVAGMTRGRRDGILKAEKQKTVVKIGPMHLKGVWIPYERALALANQEKITEKLYPLFVHNIGSLVYHPSNAARPLPLPPTYPDQRPEEQREVEQAPRL